MNNYIENNRENKNIQWESIEKKNTNWFKEKWESIKNFLEWKKNVDEIKLNEETSEKTEELKDTTIDSTLDNLNLDMQEWVELKDSDNKTREELDKFFEKWKERNPTEEKKDFQNLLKNDRFKNRSKEVVQQIGKSATNVENEIKNWDKEKNPVARSLLKFVNRIMGTEK